MESTRVLTPFLQRVPRRRARSRENDIIEMIRGRPLVTALGPEIEDGLRNFEERRARGAW